MVNQHALKETLRASLALRDPFRVASAFELPQIAQSKLELPKRQHQESLQDGSVDWSGVLSSLLDAHQAAEKV
jgi:hypothetical protein